MSYNGEQMMADAEKHYRESCTELSRNNPRRAIAAALQGLLAVRLADYAGDSVVDWVPGDPLP